MFCRSSPIAATPSPELPTRNISTTSLFLLKYWPTMREAASLVMHTPTPDDDGSVEDDEDDDDALTLEETKGNEELVELRGK